MAWGLQLSRVSLLSVTRSSSLNVTVSPPRLWEETPKFQWEQPLPLSLIHYPGVALEPTAGRPFGPRRQCGMSESQVPGVLLWSGKSLPPRTLPILHFWSRRPPTCCPCLPSSQAARLHAASLTPHDCIKSCPVITGRTTLLTVTRNLQPSRSVS